MPNVSLQLPGFVVLYRNHPLVETPFGLLDPLNVAELDSTFVADSVEAVGGLGVVAKEKTAPNPAPSPLEEIAQKK